MAIPTWSVGQVLAASDVDSWFVPAGAFSKQGATTRNTLTLSLDPGLQFTLSTANAVYEVHCGISYNCASGGLAWTFTVPSGAGGSQQAFGNLGAAGSSLSANWTDTSSANSSTAGGLLITGTISTASTTGTFGFSWASQSVAASCSVNTGSFLVARRVG